MNYPGYQNFQDQEVVEAIKDGEITRMPKKQAQEEDLFILRQINQQTKESLKQEKHIHNPQKFVREEKMPSTRLEEWRTGHLNLKKNDVVNELITNFHWHISKTRRAKGMSRPQLAEQIQTDEEILKMIEMGELPKDDFVLISRIEKALGISLRKQKKPEVTLSELQKMNEEKVTDVIEQTHKPYWERRKEQKQKEKKQKVAEITGDEIEIFEE